jgi:hypothetical protein
MYRRLGEFQGRSIRVQKILVCVQEVRWDQGGTVRAVIIITMEREMKIISWEQFFFLYIKE